MVIRELLLTQGCLTHIIPILTKLSLRGNLLSETIILSYFAMGICSGAAPRVKLAKFSISAGAFA